MTTIFGVDVGGSGVKGALVDVDTGALKTRRFRIPTPRPSTPEAVYETILAVIGDNTWSGPLGVAIPVVVVNGVGRSAANIDPAWVGADVKGALEERCGRPVVVLNDADAAGLAEMAYGSGVGTSGVVIVLTFGTGVGSGLFVDGVLVPNTEFGHLEFHGEIAEATTAGRLVERDDILLIPWAERVNDYLNYLHRLFAPELMVFGGGISKRFEDFSHVFDVPCRVVAATLRNSAGIVGAAAAAARAAEAGSQ